MGVEHKSDLSIPLVKIGDYIFNFVLPPDAGDIGFWESRRTHTTRDDLYILCIC